MGSDQRSTSIREKTCCFTGHRQIPYLDLEQITTKTEDHIKVLLDKGIVYFGIGGALGYDTLAAEILFNLRSTAYHHLKVILVYPFEGYTNRWNQEQQSHHLELLPQYDKRVCVAPYPSKGAYLQRNRHLVNNSSHCITYCTRASGGTAYTVKYAKSKGLNIINTSTFNIQTIQV